MNNFFSANPMWQTAGLTFVRLIVGYFMIYHGIEIFSPATMNEYFQWEMFQDSSTGRFMVYFGKICELIGGILLFLGLFTRVGALILMVTMSYIAFFVGSGRIWYEDQHPFLFVLLAMVFFFVGGGKWSADNFFFKNVSTQV